MMKTQSQKPNKSYREGFYSGRCYVVERSGCRKVYPKEDPFAYRQPPFDLEPLSDILVDGVSAMLYSGVRSNRRGDKIC